MIDKMNESLEAGSGQDPSLSESTEEEVQIEHEAGAPEGPLEQLRHEKEALYDRLLRTQAEFDNFRKRTTREKQEARLSAQADVIGSLLPSIDACEKGLSSLRETSGAEGLDTYREGYELLLQEIQSVLSKFGIVPVSGVGAAFDPNVHEAVVREITTDYPEGEILEEFRKGYIIQDRLLRPSQVKVAAPPDEVSDDDRE